MKRSATFTSSDKRQNLHFMIVAGLNILARLFNIYKAFWYSLKKFVKIIVYSSKEQKNPEKPPMTLFTSGRQHYPLRSLKMPLPFPQKSCILETTKL